MIISVQNAMLHAAARVALELAQQLVPDGIGLKDATRYNILFRGPEPAFIDVLSFERRYPGDPTWLPYAQHDFATSRFVRK